MPSWAYILTFVQRIMPTVWPFVHTSTHEGCGRPTPKTTVGEVGRRSEEKRRTDDPCHRSSASSWMVPHAS